MAGRGRRQVLLLMGLAGVAVGWQAFGVRGPSREAVPIEGAPGWQMMRLGEVSRLSGADLMTVGLEQGAQPLPAAELDGVVHRAGGAGTPVAVFSDFYCPFCRVLMSRLTRRIGRDPQISVSFHELPRLRPLSIWAARGAQAAALQGAYLPFYQALLSAGLRPGAAWLGQVGTDVGLDGARLARDAMGEEVAARLAASEAAAARLGVFATPGLIVGRTVVLGSVDETMFEDLVADA